MSFYVTAILGVTTSILKYQLSSCENTVEAKVKPHNSLPIIFHQLKSRNWCLCVTKEFVTIICLLSGTLWMCVE